jgi:glycine/D-amino acid oxidase-like deaminating enzyme
MPFGGVVYDGAVVDTNATMMVLEALDGITVEKKQVDEIEVGEASAVVWCTGWRAAENPLWSWLPFQPVKGEIIDAQISGPPLTSVYLRSIWVIPSSGQSPAKGMQNVRVGSTHDWENLNSKPTRDARQSLVETASILLDRDMVVTGQQAAVRPAMSSKRPVIGRHPEHPEHVILNGLGSKGALWAPWAALQLADHLVDGLPLDPEVSVQRWWKKDV